MILWPRFERLFDMNFDAIIKTTPRMFRQMEKQAGGRVLVMRYVDFILGIHRVSAQFLNSNKMLSIRIADFRTKFLSLLTAASKEGEDEYGAIAYELRLLDYIHSQMSSTEIPNAQKEYHEEIAMLKTSMGVSADRIILMNMKKHFPSLFDFINKYESKDSKVSDSHFD